MTVEIPSNNSVCMLSGFQAKRGELVLDGYGRYVLPRFAEGRQPQERVRGVVDRPEKSPRPERRDNFITTAISADDL